MYISSDTTVGRCREAKCRIIYALRKNKRVMCASFPPSIDICKAKVHVDHAHDILRGFFLPTTEWQGAHTLDLSVNLRAVNCTNAVLQTSN
jgi:hypothetical protein